MPIKRMNNAIQLTDCGEVACALADGIVEIERLQAQQTRDAALIAAKNEQVAELRAELCHQTNLYDSDIGMERSLVRELRAEIERLKAAAVPEGWALVPKQPTHDMLRSGWSIMDKSACFSVQPDASTVWNAMLKSAPQPPTAQSNSIAEDCK